VCTDKKKIIYGFVLSRVIHEDEEKKICRRKGRRREKLGKCAIPFVHSVTRIGDLDSFQ